MLKNRSIIMCIILTVVTCGIYGIYWYIVLTDEANSVSYDNKTASGLMALVYTLLTCGIYSFYWMYKQGLKIDEAKSSRGMSSSGTGIVYLILAIFGLGIVSYCLIQNELNKLA